MKKYLFIVLAYVFTYLIFLFVEFQYVWIVKKDINLFWREEIFTDPIFHSVLATTLTILLAYVTKKKK